MIVALAALVIAGISLESKVAAISPTPDEQLWLSIPWRTNIMRARVESQETNKPMFLWIMNGHPLGCT
jgi:hypothetical protein